MAGGAVGEADRTSPGGRVAPVARRYARAVFDIARDRGRIDEQQRELEQVLEILRRSEQLRTLFEHQLVHPRVKREVVGKVLGGVGPVTRNLLFVIIDKHREGVLGDVVRAYRQLADQARGLTEVEVRSAVPVAPRDIQALERRLSGRLGKSIKVRTQVDPALLGGLVVRAGDLLMDGSLKTRLARLRERLAGGAGAASTPMTGGASAGGANPEVRREGQG